MKTYEKHEFTRAALAAVHDPNMVDPMDVMRKIADEAAANPPPKPDAITGRVTIANSPNKTFGQGPETPPTET